MSDRLRELAERYEKSMREAGKEVLLIQKKMFRTGYYMATADASKWTRLKVKFKNWMLRLKAVGR